MDDLELLLTAVCVFLVAWCRFLSKLIATLQKAVVGLQGVAINQIAINAQNANVRGLLEEVNESLAKIVREG